MIEKRTPPLDPIKQVCLAEKYDIPHWLAPAFESLCQRDGPLEIYEAERIGLRHATLLARARETIRDSARDMSPRIGSGWGPVDWGVNGSRPSSAGPAKNLPYDTSFVTHIVQTVFFPAI